MKRCWYRGMVASLLLLSFLSFGMQAPAGVRPCCAFGTDLKAQLGAIPVPFFSLENVVEANKLGRHVYNDGSQGVTSSLLGMADELNGLVYTSAGGFIDIAHVRDTADFTYYLYRELWPFIGTGYELMLPAELRLRKVQLVADDRVLTVEQKRADGIALAGMLAFQLAQWHEVAQWYGLKSVGGWSELASAFSPEDLYSNMLGAKLAMEVLNTSPQLSVAEFAKRFTQQLTTRLKQLGGVSKDETERKIRALDGIWWDSSKRLPDKWVLRQRDYNLSMSLTPHYAEQPLTLSLPMSPYGHLVLQSAKEEDAFAALPESLRGQHEWHVDRFQLLADVARRMDLAERTDAEVSRH